MGDFAADGTVVHTTDLNKILKLSGVGAAYAGSPPATGAESGYLEQAGTTVVTTNGAGGFSINFSPAFPSGLVTAITTCGDDSTGKTVVTLIAAQCDKTHIGGVITSNMTAVVSGTARVNWIARGF